MKHFEHTIFYFIVFKDLVALFKKSNTVTNNRKRYGSTRGRYKDTFINKNVEIWPGFERNKSKVEDAIL